MASFRLQGTAWDGQRFVTAKAISTLAHQIEQVRPVGQPSDGTVASKGHDAGSPNSDHTVWPKEARSGTVYAIDFGEPPGTQLVDEILESIRLSKDARCKYAIHHNRMFSSYKAHGFPPFTWRPYSGRNSHKTHGHMSVHHDARGSDGKLWDIGTPTTIPGDEDMSQFIKDEQDNLNESGFRDFEGKRLVVDGEAGPRTKSAMLARDKAAAENRQGMSQAEADARYVLLGQPHTLRKT